MENVCVNCGESNRVALTQRTTGEWQYLCGACCGRLWQTIVPDSRKKQKRSKRKIQAVICPDCGKERHVASNVMSMIRSGAHSGRCHSCAAKKTNEERYRGHEPQRNYCVDCGKAIQANVTRCLSCHLKCLDATRTRSFCVDCGEEISLGATRCVACAAQARSSHIEALWKSGVYAQVSKKIKAAHRNGTFEHIHQDPEWRRKVSENVRAAHARGCYDGCNKPPFRTTEVPLAAALDICGIEHDSQYRPPNCRFRFDEFIPPNILIEANGDYWHSKETAKKRDIKKGAWAKRNGYELVVIWEHEIKERGAWALVHERVLPLLADY